MHPTPLFWVDAFTDRPFSGNPAAICLLDQPAAETWMQALATEMNLSETAFAHPEADGQYRLRWFTPKIEVELCGHATLAAAHVLWTEGRLPANSEARFLTLSGLLTVRLDRSGEPHWMEMDFPARPPRSQAAPSDLLAALGLPQGTVIGRNGNNDWVVEAPAESDVRMLRPDFGRLAAIDARGVCVTAIADKGGSYDFVSRFFGPRVGINEDPVTGSAHASLGPMWSERLGGKCEMLAYQASARGGTVRIRYAPGNDRVLLGGQAVTIHRAALAV